jgi:hypothetical protein
VEYRAHVHLRVELESLDSLNRNVSTIMEGDIGVPLVARGRPVVDDRARVLQVIVSAGGDGSMIPAPEKSRGPVAAGTAAQPFPCRRPREDRL